ncbi:hypothetical protein TL16_g08662 [Triparma laevis f. inornata]|uniref:Uncharacterized protein n=1 Tax=Triparma laevis f. inornata TaxID=1714386 RepID=A0A9W7EIZ0_9STRA|nr:hypothetical protein TL16_g08662 [Triparma laevis f. inornata]
MATISGLPLPKSNPKPNWNGLSFQGSAGSGSSSSFRGSVGSDTPGSPSRTLCGSAASIRSDRTSRGSIRQQQTTSLRQIGRSPGRVARNAEGSTLPLEGDLQMLLMFLCEIMKSRKLVTKLPVCDKTGKLTRSDCVKLAKGFDFFSKTPESEEDAVCLYLDKFPAMMFFTENYSDFENLLVFTSIIQRRQEAIPGTIIQTYAFLKGSNHSSGAIFSLVVSVLTAAFTSTTVSWDLDVDNTKRAATPQFYGVIPDGMRKKVRVFILVFLMATCQLISKALACALCAVESKFVVFIYLGIDMLAYFVYKLARRDLTYWVPVYGLAGVSVTVLVRYAAKFITDFTAMIHLRHPHELGGSY